MAQVQDHSSLAKPDPEWLAAVEAMGGQLPDIGNFSDIPTLRKFLKEMEAGNPTSEAPPAGFKQSDHQVSMRDGAKITCRVYQPENPPQSGSPLIVMYHGGGWSIGDLSYEEPLCRALTSELGATCVNVDYRLAPEHKFPAAAHDAIDAAKWAADNATTLGADPTKGFIVGGTSAGGNLTAIVSHHWRDEGLSPPLTGSHYMIPLVVHHSVVPPQYQAAYRSWDELVDAPILSRAACDLFFDSYAPDVASPLFSPLLTPGGPRGLPPAAFQICGLDPLRDEALLFERLMREGEGIPTRLHVYPGVPHGFWAIAPQLELSKRLFRDSVASIQWLLEQKK